MNALYYLLFSFLGYLSGSVLFCYCFPLWFKKIDITKQSSDKNPGAFNCFCFAGPFIGIPALLCDLLKGAIPVFAAARFTDIQSPAFALVMIAPVLGHAFPVFRNFGGGKAITVTFGVLLGLLPFWQPVVLLAVIYLFFSLCVRVYPNRRRSMVVFLCFGVLSVVWLRAGAVSLGCAVNSAVVFIKHKFSPEGESGQSFVKLPIINKRFFEK